MLKTLLSQVKQYTLASILTPLCMIGEVICEMIIPYLMGNIVDIGIYGGNMNYIFSTGGVMIAIAILGLIAGLLGAYFGSMASTGLAKKDVATTVEAFMDVIKSSLLEKENVYLRGFGSFIVKHRAEKTARNISKNTTIVIAAHDFPSFKPAKSFVAKMKGEEVDESED